jgi:hypothetical protein
VFPIITYIICELGGVDKFRDATVALKQALVRREAAGRAGLLQDRATRPGPVSGPLRGWTKSRRFSVGSARNIADIPSPRLSNWRLLPPTVALWNLSTPPSSRAGERGQSYAASGSTDQGWLAAQTAHFDKAGAVRLDVHERTELRGMRLRLRYACACACDRRDKKGSICKFLSAVPVIIMLDVNRLPPCSTIIAERRIHV